MEKAEAAKRDCAISKALAGVEEIKLEARLVEHRGNLSGRSDTTWKVVASHVNSQYGRFDGTFRRFVARQRR